MADDAARPLEGTRIGWIGTGVMGCSMAGRLHAAGARVTVHTRTPEKAAALRNFGIGWVDDPRELLATSDLVFTMVGYPADVEEVYLGVRGLVPALEGSEAPLLIDMTTSAPALAARVDAAARERGTCALDAPVSGGDVGAREGTLSIMVGGDLDAFERARPAFEVLGRTIVRQGAAGAGQHTKMVNQTLIATNMIGMCEGLLYAERAGLDPQGVLASVGGGAAGSWSVANLAPRILRGDFAPGFFVEHFIKDLGIALDEAHRMELALPGLALAKQLYEAVRAQGHGRAGTQALYLALRQLSARSGGAER
ncbi:MAG: NAD(P)-dependent oxidoreductase [Planctomycetota bacterium]|jgi:3-hydroxyisobutyrate dehydrogenase